MLKGSTNSDTTQYGHGYMTILEKLGHVTAVIQQFIYTIIY